jgi:O-antigen ligase
VALACATGIVLSASKGAIVALVAALIVAYGFGGRAMRVAFAGVAILCATGALVFTIGPLRHVLEYRLQRSALDYSIGERLDLYRLAWDEFVRHPLFGIGLNNFSVSSHRLTGVDTVPHNLELGYLAELGLPGLGLVLAGLVALLGLGWQARRHAPAGGEYALGVSLWATFLAAAIHNQFESTIYGEQYKLVLMLTIAAAARLTAGWIRPGSGSNHPVS